MRFTPSTDAAHALLRRMFDAAIASAQPATCLPVHLPSPDELGNGRLIVVGAGKASAAMARVVEDHWPGPISGLVVTRYGHAVPCERIEIVQAAHPVPDEAGLLAARRTLELVGGLTDRDLVLCLISGGGSALWPLPLGNLTLEHKQAIRIEMRGGHLAGHSRRTADLCRRIAEKLKQERKFVHEVFIAALMHEIGKVGFSDKLLLTPVSLLKSVQLDSYRRHILQAEQLLMPLQDLRGSCEMIGSQFERFDGQGFPEHIAGNVIPLGARILAVASDYDNLQTGTLAQRQLSPAEAKNRIVEGRGSRYDPVVVNALVELMGGVAQDDYRPRFGERRLLASELKMGMRLSRDLITPSGLLMLSADHVMDQHLVDKIAAFEKSSDLHLTAWVRVELPA